MAKQKVRCAQCGAKNDEVEMCRICGLLLPCAAELRRRGTGADAETFNENVEREREAWQDHLAGRTTAGARSRRPEELPRLSPHEWDDPVAAVKVAAGVDPDAGPSRRSILPWRR